VPAPQVLDACPGILALHPARDGHVARIRLPGGYVSGPRWRALTALSRDFGNGCLDLTARGNAQLRGVPEEAAAGLARAAAAAGLLPSWRHDRARNISASPLAGLGGRAPLRHLVRDLDAALIADPGLAALPGRFLWAVDDGGGAGLAGCDIGLLRTAGGGALARPDTRARRAGRGLDLVVAGRLTGIRAAGPAAAVQAAVATARAAVARGVGASVTRIRDLADGGESVAAAIGGTLGTQPPDHAARLPLGRADCDTRVLVVAAPLGRLTAAQLDLAGQLLRPGEVIRLAAAGRLVIPLRVPPADALSRLADAGLITSDADELAGVTACSGNACLQALADVRAAARPLPGHERTHWAGCGRQCGRPRDADPVTALGPDRFLVPGLAEPQPLTLLTGSR
jgi:precorrin-3B synthase